jgi:hypothetical protein
MKKTFFFAFAMLSASAFAQETYESAQLATTDLNGTARYVGMGGAMEALGADISTISSNPAGIGVFHRSWAGISAGATIQSGDGIEHQVITKSGVTNADLNQVGFVYSSQVGQRSWLNVGFNFSKSRNFNQIIGAESAVSLDRASSLSKSTALVGYNYNTTDRNTPIAYDLVFNTFNNNISRNKGTKDSGEPSYPYAISNRYLGQREISGYIGNYDFNISGSINDRVFLGLTLGIKDVHYDSDSYYSELLGNGNYLENRTAYLPVEGSGELGIRDNRRITGTGIDVKFGAIFRPIEESPFRIGIYVHTPTWYRLKFSSTMYGYGKGTYEKVSYNDAGDRIITNESFNSDNQRSIKNTYRLDDKYAINTPWRFGASFGHTIGTMVALGLTYEFADYSSIKNKIYGGTYVNYYDRYDRYNDDTSMNQNTDKMLKGVHTIKFGAEVKPVDNVAIRMGYNYVSAIYADNAYKPVDKGSLGYEYCMTDYVNWKGVNRITFGLGFQLMPQLCLDFSYQYATQKGTYYPYAGYDRTMEGITISVDPTTTEVKNNRHQLNLSLGYRF